MLDTRFTHYQDAVIGTVLRLTKPDKSLFFISSAYHFPFPLGKTFTIVFAIQEFAKKTVFRFFMKAYLLSNSFPFLTFDPENLFLIGLTLDPSREISEDKLWYIWCLTVLYATKLIVLVTATLDHLLDPNKSTSLIWTLPEWFSQLAKHKMLKLKMKPWLISIKRLIISVYELIILSLKWIRSLPRCSKFTKIFNPESLN